MTVRESIMRILEAMEREEAEAAEWIRANGLPKMIGLSAFLNAVQTWHMPDGTKTATKPRDGAVWTKFDPANGDETWQWDGQLEQWFNVSSGKPGAHNTKTFVVPQPICPMDLDNMDAFDLELEKSGLYEPRTGRKQARSCECGSEKCGSNKHSSWCPKFSPSP